jgi:type II secretion system protein G
MRAARSTRAEADIRFISKALEWCKDDTGDYPTETQYVAALGIKPEGADSSVWWARYLEKGIPKDPWGNEYVYAILSKNDDKLDFDLYSLGEDRQSATGGNDPDDINNWDPESGSYYRQLSLIQFIAERAAYLVFVTLPVLATLVVLRFVLPFVVRCWRRRRTLTKESS